MMTPGPQVPFTRLGAQQRADPHQTCYTSIVWIIMTQAASTTFSESSDSTKRAAPILYERSVYARARARTAAPVESYQRYVERAYANYPELKNRAENTSLARNDIRIVSGELPPHPVATRRQHAGTPDHKRSCRTRMRTTGISDSHCRTTSRRCTATGIASKRRVTRFRCVKTQNSR